ncbi:UNVERIFIED_CONTAM: hypothetical protein PYX00_002984 [Menopon gallinae]|uniref:Uncharacterized protein n=1 Tax=Menopon gallinae TaxID=328185 RepID=A0AAW2HZW5_9NEOP
MIARMKWLTILIHHLILLDIALALALAGNKADPKENPISEAATTKTTLTTTTTSSSTTTQAPVKVADAKENSKKPLETTSKQSETLEKPLPKKRGAIEYLYHSQGLNADDNGYDPEEPTPEEIFSGSRSDVVERPYFRYDDSAFVNDDGYFENDGRRKRTAMFDGMYNRPQEYSNPDVELSPEEIMQLLSLLEERRLYGAPVQSQWPDYDNTIDSIEADMRDEDIYRPRPGNRFDDLYDSNVDRYPTGMKRFMVTRRRRSNFLGNPKLKVPVLRRAIL